ncbi:hypothetical protein AC804_10440 [Chryseobacterium sp. Hurlbut01]|nr:hypothetical protein AC804_10440 [Chryseobacterium sp. Hurlbut01]
MDYIIESQNELGQLKLKIIVTNKTDKPYLLPIDTSSFKGYYESEYCGIFEDQDYPYKFFAPTVMLKEENKQEYLFPGSSKGHLPEGDGSEEYIKSLINTANKEINEVEKWKKKYDLKNKKDAIKNYYLTKNLLFLKPNEKHVYTIVLELGNINRENASTLYDYYSFEFKKYFLALHLCITNDAYNWLTIKQKKRFKKFIFFTGTIRSNDVLFEPIKKIP